MSVLDDWINPYYLTDDAVEDIRESVLAKPAIRYTVLDNFFKTDKLDQLIAHHHTLQFSEDMDRRSPKNGELLPYDGSVCFAQPGVHFGSDLFFDDEWHRYCCYLTDTKLNFPAGTEIKLRYHRPHADGFWIHTDSTIRSVVAITYFNKNWRLSDGGVLQLWRIDEATDPNAFTIESPKGRMDFLTQHTRIRTRTPGGGFPDKRSHDLVLIDQVVPAYNRIFLCNFQHSPAYHSVTPSGDKARLGFVQWLFERDSRK